VRGKGTVERLLSRETLLILLIDRVEILEEQRKKINEHASAAAREQLIWRKLDIFCSTEDMKMKQAAE
jgi:hypothetical protein